MVRLGLCRVVFAACLFAPLALVAMAGPAQAEEADAEGSDKAGVDSAYVKVTLTKGEDSFAHPGFRVAIDEEGVFVINCDGKDHEVVVTIREASETNFKIEVDYSVNGNEQLSESLDATVGTPVELRKGKTALAIDLDPRGQKDTSRKDGEKILGPDSDDPLGGM